MLHLFDESTRFPGWQDVVSRSPVGRAYFARMRDPRATFGPYAEQDASRLVRICASGCGPHERFRRLGDQDNAAVKAAARRLRAPEAAPVERADEILEVATVR